MQRLVLVIVLFTISLSLFGQSKEDGLNSITEEIVKAQLDFLASDWMEGRETGTRGSYLAADYLVSMFKIYGLQPAGDTETIMPSRREMMAGANPKENQTYYQNFSLLEYDSGEDQQLAIIINEKEGKRKINFNYKTDFDVRTSTVGIEIESPVVFVGYGYKNDEHGYNDFKGIDIKNKIILRLAGYPGHNDSTSEGYKNQTKGQMGRMANCTQ